jgi:hypothetical protein
MIFTMAKSNCDKEKCQIVLLLKGFDNLSTWLCHFGNVSSPLKNMKR